MMRKIKTPMCTTGELSRFLLWWWGAGRVSASFFFLKSGFPQVANGVFAEVGRLACFGRPGGVCAVSDGLRAPATRYLLVPSPFHI
jgi:hypothetical protein